MTTLKFLRKLADELQLPLEQLDEHTVEYVLDWTDDPIRGAKLYQEHIQDQVNP